MQKLKMCERDYFNYFSGQSKNIIVSIDGDRGEGKTILMVYFLAKYGEGLRKIVNFKLDLPLVESLEIDELIDLNDKKRVMVGITESTTLLESTRGMTNLNLYLKYVAMQSRKIGNEGIDILIDEQVLESISGGFLTQCNIFITALGLGEKGFYYKMSARVHNQFTVPVLKVLDFETVFKLKDIYDTKERIEPVNIENLKINVMSPKKQKVIVDSLVKEILENKRKYGLSDDVKHVTMKQCSSILLDMEKSDSLSYFLHPRINAVLVQQEVTQQ